MQILKYSLYISLLFLNGCETQKLIKEKFIFTIPIVRPDSTIESFKTDFNIISYKSFFLYELPYSESLQIEDSLISDTMKYEYFIFRKEEKYGYLLKNLNDSFKEDKRKKVDSLLTLRGFYNFSLDSMLSLKNNSYQVEKTGTDVFRVKYPSPNIEIDSIFIYFDKRYGGMKYTMAKNLDAAFKSKLYKTEFWLNRKGQTGVRPDQLIANHEIKQDTLCNEKEVLDFFARFEKLKNL